MTGVVLIRPSAARHSCWTPEQVFIATYTGTTLNNVGYIADGRF